MKNIYLAYFKLKKLLKFIFESVYTFFLRKENKCSDNIFSYKIGFAILSHERPEYLNVCLSTLFQSDISNLDVTFFIIDDGSKNEQVKKIINKQSPDNFKVYRIFADKGKNNAGAAINRAVRIMQSYDNFDIIGWADPDCLFHPQWILQTLKICIWARNNHKFNLLGPFTSFNSSDYVFHDIKGTYSSPFGSYVVKRQAGMLNYFMFKSDWEKFGPFEESDSDETIMTDKLAKKIVRNYSTQTSYVEHIGQNSILNNWREKKINRAVYGVNLEKCGWPPELLLYKNVGYYKNVNSNHSFGDSVYSRMILDVFIPCALKDLQNLELCIEGIKKNLAHPIGRINIVAPLENKIISICKSLNVNFIDENHVLKIDKKSIKYSLNGYDRSNWLYQQLLKLSFSEFTSHENYLVVDADTIFIKKQKFEHNGKLLLQISDEFHKPYFEVYSKLTNRPPVSLLSSVAHSMLFNNKILNSLKNEISKQCDKPWIDAILEKTDKNDLSGFSEYETYGLWAIDNFETIIFREYFFNKFLLTNRIHSLKTLSDMFSMDYKSVSIHKYTN